MKNSKDLIGRKVELSELHFNYLKMSVRLVDFTMYEVNDKDVFTGFEEVYVNFQPWRLIKNEYSFKEIRIKEPHAAIILEDGLFNFDDFIVSDTTDVEEPDTTESDVRFEIRNFSLISGDFVYEDKDIESKTELGDFSLEIPHFAWDSKSSDAGIKFDIGENGEVIVDADIKQEADEFLLSLKANSIDISPYQNYLKDFLYVSDVSGELNTDLSIGGKMSAPENLVIKGGVAINELSAKDGDQNKLISLKELKTEIEVIDLEAEKYDIASVELDGLHLYAALNNDMSNIEKVIAPLMPDDEGADSVDVAEAENEVDSTITEESDMYYNVGSLLLKNSQISFDDNTLNRPFSYDIFDMNVEIGAINEVNDLIPVNFAMNMNNMGDIKGESGFSLKNPDVITFSALIDKLDLSSFSPYSEFYLASPVTKGALTYKASLMMQGDKLINKNNVLISELEFGKKTDDEPVAKVPMKLALYLIKDKDDNIEIDLPVKGNPSSPDFKLGKLIWQTFAKFLVKTAASPFQAMGKLIGTNPEALEFIPFENTVDSLSVNQKEQLDKLAEIYHKKPEFVYSFVQLSDFEVEKKELILQEAKKMWLKSLGKTDTTNEKDGLADDDPGFIAWMQLILNTSDSLGISLADEMINPERQALIFDEFLKRREAAVRNYLIMKGLKPDEDFTVNLGDFRNIAIENRKTGFSVEVSIK